MHERDECSIGRDGAPLSSSSRVRRPVLYSIRIQGHLDPDWSEWLQGLTIAHDPNGSTVLMGSLDQAALFGVLIKIRDLGLTLISVNPVKSCEPAAFFK